jgi:hypothetical protein
MNSKSRSHDTHSSPHHIETDGPRTSSCTTQVRVQYDRFTSSPKAEEMSPSGVWSLIHPRKADDFPDAIGPLANPRLDASRLFENLSYHLDLLRFL